MRGLVFITGVSGPILFWQIYYKLSTWKNKGILILTDFLTNNYWTSKIISGKIFNIPPNSIQIDIYKSFVAPVHPQCLTLIQIVIYFCHIAHPQLSSHSSRHNVRFYPESRAVAVVRGAALCLCGLCLFCEDAALLSPSLQRQGHFLF